MIIEMKTVKYNKAKLRDKIYACWLGKNIGGTIGTPYEGCTEMLDVKGFKTEPGKPLPNDDLDLQLMWLVAMEQEGPWYLNSRTLSEYWLMGISPYWNEYGRAKANLTDGVPAPLSGELHNEKWRNSNGAWIRSEIWAALAPGYPSISREYAYADACVDHGMGEGTIAEIFTASLQSKAYFMDDIRAVIEEGLKAIPEDSRVYKAVRLVIDEYDKGTPYRDVRNMLVEQSRDIGMFQAPANLGFVAIGLLYGEGDFKNSVLYATNCGDDTDCTAATVGSILGIMYGTKGLPEDWVKHIGDTIDFICIETMYRAKIAKTCTELTDRIMDLIPIVLYAHRLMVEWTDDEFDLPEYKEGFHLNQLQERGRYCFDLPHNPFLYGFGEYDREPIVKPGEQITIRLNVNNGGGAKSTRAYIGTACWNSCNYEMKLILPDGWTADYRRVLAVPYDEFEKTYVWEATITVGENVNAVNHAYLIATANNHNSPVFVDFVIKA